MKICILGNSHAASLKSAWDEIKLNYKNIDITFFAMIERGLENLKIENNVLIPIAEKTKEIIKFTSDGKEYIDPSEYDYFLIYGLQIKAYRINNIFYSSQVQLQTVNDLIESSVSYKILKQLREITDKLIYVGHNPLPAQSTNKVVIGSESKYLEGINLMNKLLFNDFNAVLLNQPLSTIGSSFETKKIFSTGSCRLDTTVSAAEKIRTYGIEDKLHMNKEFGILYLEGFIDIVINKEG